MGKILSWLLLIALVWGIWKFIVLAQRKQQAREAQRNRKPPAAANDPQASGARAGSDPRGRAGSPPSRAEPLAGGELMVRCANCGLYLPKSESVTAGPHHYCSVAHREAGPRQHEQLPPDPRR